MASMMSFHAIVTVPICRTFRIWTVIMTVSLISWKRVVSMPTMMGVLIALLTSLKLTVWMMDFARCH